MRSRTTPLTLIVDSDVKIETTTSMPPQSPSTSIQTSDTLTLLSQKHDELTHLRGYLQQLELRVRLYLAFSVATHVPD